MRREYGGCLSGNVPTENVFLPQLFRTLTFSTFSAGSKGGGAFPDDGSRRVSHLFEVPEKKDDLKRMT
ncbi:MAG: hypothetical protein J6J44_03430 [Lachnospiraceae bacterium]|nr:hypothetical protein [Lachnospiraceae bacterium]